MLIEDLITRSPATIRVGQRLSEAAARMAERGVGSVVVTGEGEDPVGIVTDRDVALWMSEGVEDAMVEEVMSANPLAVDRSTDVETCIEKMDAHGVRRILVLNEDEDLVGVVSLDDIVIHLSNVLSKAGDLIRAEVVGVR